GGNAREKKSAEGGKGREKRHGRGGRPVHRAPSAGASLCDERAGGSRRASLRGGRRGRPRRQLSPTRPAPPYVVITQDRADTATHRTTRPTSGRTLEGNDSVLRVHADRS